MFPARRTATAATVVLATAGGLLTTATAPASAAGCTSPAYTRQFFANTTFSGTPKRTDCDSAVGEYWSGAPASGLPADNFGVRWTVTRDFGSGGPFSLAVRGQDGMRVYLDGSRRIDLWKNTSSTVWRTVNLTVPPGKHTLRVDYVNWTGAAAVSFTYTPLTSATADKVKPLAPAGLAVSYDRSTGRARLTWAANKEMDLAGYRVYRRLQGASFPATPLATTTATAYTDSTLPMTGATYAYEIRAYDKAGNTSYGSADIAVTTVDRNAPGAPGGLQVTDTSEADGLRLGWNPVDQAVSYRVYRAPGESGPFSLIGSTGQPSYQDTTGTPGVAYVYRVSAVDAAGNASAPSVVVTGRRSDDTPPSAVTGLTATATDYGFHLAWDANPTPDLARYVVYPGRLIGDDEQKMCEVYQLEWLSTDTTSYDYATLPDGEERCFFIDAVDDDWNSHYGWTHAPNIVTATELDTTPNVPTPEGAPVHLGATVPQRGLAQVELNWNPVADAAGYQVYRWNPETEAYEKLAQTAQATYLDTGAATGTTHYYWVTALYADGSESAPGADWASLAP
ncbi:fibronectin type III domain-containing protein [Streptomyces griseosporeus]|uniref:fibronectin type III domain-containing protein n=1 Tax=Streptomyces griseosporeus TaxID=1910 RepID=UPI003700EA9D